MEVDFINLVPEMDPLAVDAFAYSFHPTFKGIYITQRELMQIDHQFSLFFSKGLSDPLEMNHSDHLYLVEKSADGQFILKNIYSTHPFDPQQLRDDIQHLNKERL